MKYRTRTFYTDKQKSEMWDRWQRGDSMSSIGRHFNRVSHETIYRSLYVQTRGVLKKALQECLRSATIFTALWQNRRKQGWLERWLLLITDAPTLDLN